VENLLLELREIDHQAAVVGLQVLAQMEQIQQQEMVALVHLIPLLEQHYFMLPAAVVVDQELLESVLEGQVLVETAAMIQLLQLLVQSIPVQVAVDQKIL
jgi:hypothetical protein